MPTPTGSPSASLVAVVAAVVVTCTGCGGRHTAQSRTIIPGKTCAAGVARPVPLNALVASLRAHGVTARRDTYCASPDAIAQVSNLSLAVSEARQRQVRRREGAVICLLTAERGPRKLRRIGYGKTGPVLVVLNLTCSVYPVGVAAETQVRRVVVALKELERRYS